MFHELQDVGVADEIQKEEQAVQRLRERLLQTFETAEAAFAALDLHGLGMLSFEELRDSLDGWGIDVEEVTCGVNLKRLFSILDIDGSGTLSINELMDTIPWRVEDEGILLLRQKLREIYGSRENVIRFVDTNADGKISLEELRKCLKAHAKSGVDDFIGGLDLSRIFNILDYDFSGELSLNELLDSDPRKEAALRDEAINELRRSLLSFFGTSEQLMNRLDANMNGLLSYGEFKDGLDRCRFDYKKVLGQKSLLWIFNVMDVTQRGDLSLHDLLEANSTKLHMRAAEARRQRLIRRKTRSRTTLTKRSRSVASNSLGEIPPSHIDLNTLTPGLKRICAFGLQESLVADGVESSPTDGKKKKKNMSSISRSREDTTSLDMTHCYIGEGGALFLANSLLEPRFEKLQTLQLRANYIGIKASCWIACACEKLPALRSLGLSWNHIEDSAASRIANMITVVKTLKELDLSFNRIGTDGAQKLSKSLMDKAIKLQILDLRFNSIEKSGVNRLRATARKVVEVRLEGNLGSDPSNESPIINPRITGGHVLPQIREVVVTGWPRTSTTRQGKRPHTDACDEDGFSKQSAVRMPCTPSRDPVLLPELDGTVSARIWPAARGLVRNLSEAALTACGNRRAWSRSAIRRHCQLEPEVSFTVP